jgi:hypothetical protein
MSILKFFSTAFEQLLAGRQKQSEKQKLLDKQKATDISWRRAQFIMICTTPRQKALNKLTNWQRNQAGCACKGDWGKLDLTDIEFFTNLKRA